MGSRTPPIWQAAERWTRLPIWAQEPTRAWESIMVPSSTIGADVDVGGRHHDDAGGEVGSGADGAAAGDDADALLGGEAAGGVGGLVDEGEGRVVVGVLAHLGEGAEAEAEEDAALDPGVDAVAGGGGGVGLGGAEGAGLEGVAEGVEGSEGVRVADGGGALGEPVLDEGFEVLGGGGGACGVHGWLIVAAWGSEEGLTTGVGRGAGRSPRAPPIRSRK